MYNFKHADYLENYGISFGTGARSDDGNVRPLLSVCAMLANLGALEVIN